MKKIAIALTNVIYENNPSFSELDLKKIQFGLECFFGDSSKLIMYFIFFFLINLESYYIIAALFFMILRGFAGGYHEKTYLRCLTSSFILFLVMVYSGTYLNFNVYARGVLGIISLLLIFIYAPVDHPNKPIVSEKRRKNLKINSVIIFIIMLIISLLMGGKFGNTALMALFVESITLPLGYYSNKIH